MDRNKFLSCQAFLFPLSNSWLDSVDRSQGSYRSEILLANHQLSIEATCIDDVAMDLQVNESINSNENSANNSLSNVHKSLGPCFFSCPTEGDGSDCAMSKIDLTVHTADIISDRERVITTPVKDFGRQGRSLFGGRYPSEMEESYAAEREAVLVANIDGFCFQVDLRSLQCLQSLPAKEKEEPFDRTNGASGNEKPACLVLQFPSCLFRIFPTFLDSNDSPSIVNLDAVESRLESLMVPTYMLPFPLCCYGENCDASRGYSQGDTQGHRVDDSFWTGFDYPTKLYDCMQSDSQSWKAVTLMEHVLCTPVSPEERDAGSLSRTLKEKLKVHVASLLTRIPELVSRSYADDAELSEAVESCNTNLSRQHDEIDETFHVFWSPPSKERPNKRRRLGSHNGDPEKIQQNCIYRTRDVLKKHKELLAAKYQFTRLPMRG